jgi:hypothetical protein
MLQYGTFRFWEKGLCIMKHKINVHLKRKTSNKYIGTEGGATCPTQKQKEKKDKG